MQILIYIVLTLVTAHAFAAERLVLTHHAKITAAGPNKSLPVALDRDPEINSPKSVRFSADGTKLYINALEGGKTVVYAWPELRKIKTISHKFTVADRGLFQGESNFYDYPYYARVSDTNVFMGKPVESELSHGGRWLWIPYYRRDYDHSGQSPSAVAIVDTQTDEIVRVMPTGPIPKYVAASPDGRYVVVTHWGDNTLGLIDTSSGDPRNFKYAGHLTVEKRMSQAGLGGTNRDGTCGFCLRGTVFTADSKHILVARMGGGGIAGFEVATQRYLGTVTDIAATPRHLALSPDGSILYASSNGAGVVSKAYTAAVVQALESARGGRVVSKAFVGAHVGSGARTLAVSHDGKLIFVALNRPSKLAVLDSGSLKTLAIADITPFAVGLAVAQDLSGIAVTSQGRAGQGGGETVSVLKLGVVSDSAPALRLR